MYDAHVELAMKCLLTNRYLHGIHVRRHEKLIAQGRDRSSFSLNIHQKCVQDHTDRLEAFLQNDSRRNQLIKLTLYFDDARYRAFADAHQRLVFPRMP